MRKDNRGLTLIELVVTVAIAMVFSGVILTFVAGASKSYRRTSAGAQSQIEMQDALDQIENLTISTNLSMYYTNCLLYTSPSPRDRTRSRMPSSA